MCGKASTRSWKGGRQRGFTLLEVAVYLSILLIIGGPLVTAVLVSARSTTENDAINAATERNRTAVMRMEKEVRRAIGTTVGVFDSGRTLTLTGPAGFDGVAIIPGETVSFTFRPSASESVNGLDDDGNGLVDEGELVRQEVLSGAESVVATGIDMNASGFAPSGTGYSLTVTSMGKVETTGDKAPFRVSKSITVYPRN